MQVEARESKSLLFETFWFFFFFFPTGSIEELALLKIVKNDARIKFSITSAISIPNYDNLSSIMSIII